MHCQWRHYGPVVILTLRLRGHILLCQGQRRPTVDFAHGETALLAPCCTLLRVSFKGRQLMLLKSREPEHVSGHMENLSIETRIHEYLALKVVDDINNID